MADVRRRQRPPPHGRVGRAPTAVPPPVDLPRSGAARVPARRRLRQRLRRGVRRAPLGARPGDRPGPLALRRPPVRLVVARARRPPSLRHLHREPRVSRDSVRRRARRLLPRDRPHPLATRARPLRVVTGGRRRHRLRRRPGRIRLRRRRPHRSPAVALRHRGTDQGFGLVRIRADLHRQLRRRDVRPLGAHRPAALAQRRPRQLLLHRSSQRRPRLRRLARRTRLRVLGRERRRALELRDRQLRLRLAGCLARPRPRRLVRPCVLRPRERDRARSAGPFDAGASISGAASVIDGLVYFSSFDHRTYALTAAGGRLRAKWPDGEYSPAVAGDGRLYLVGLGRIYALTPAATSR